MLQWISLANYLGRNVKNLCFSNFKAERYLEKQDNLQYYNAQNN